MPFSAFRGLWRATFHNFQRACRRPACYYYRSPRRFKLLFRASTFYAAFRYGLWRAIPLSAAAAIVTTTHAKADSDSAQIKRDDASATTASPGHSGSHSLVGLSDAAGELEEGKKWDEVYEDQNIKVFRRCRDDLGGIYEYKCTGTYNDITPTNFVETQNDLDYRRQWDENVVSLEMVEEADDAQVISWVVRFPRPMYARQYIYVRRKFVEPTTQTIVVLSRALDTDEHPDSGKYVRVVRYMSKLVVRAHTTLTQKGLDYTLVYYDDPKSSIPTMAYNWIVNQGGPYFMKKIYQAAREREKSVDAAEAAEAKSQQQKHPTTTAAESQRDTAAATRREEEDGEEMECVDDEVIVPRRNGNKQPSPPTTTAAATTTTAHTE